MKLIAEITQGENKGLKVYVTREWIATDHTIYCIEYKVKGVVWIADFGQFQIITGDE